MQSYEISVHANGFGTNHNQIINVTQSWFLLLLFFFLPPVIYQVCKSSYCSDEEAFLGFFSFLGGEKKKSWELRDLM